MRGDGAFGASPEDTRMLRCWSTSTMEKGCLACRKLWGDLTVAFQCQKEPTGKVEMDSLSGSVMMGQGVTALNCKI